MKKIYYDISNLDILRQGMFYRKPLVNPNDKDFNNGEYMFFFYWSSNGLKKQKKGGNSAGYDIQELFVVPDSYTKEEAWDIFLKAFKRKFAKNIDKIRPQLEIPEAYKELIEKV